MNAERRKALDTLISDIQGVVAQIEEFKSSLEDPMGEEQEYYDNMPEGFQNGEKGEKAQAAVSAMEEADGKLDEAVSALEEAISSLEEAKE